MSDEASPGAPGAQEAATAKSGAAEKKSTKRATKKAATKKKATSKKKASAKKKATSKKKASAKKKATAKKTTRKRTSKKKASAAAAEPVAEETALEEAAELEAAPAAPAVEPAPVAIEGPPSMPAEPLSERVVAHIGGLPTKSLVVTNAYGGIAGVLPSDTLVVVDRGIARDAEGAPVALDPQATQKAFSWLIGRKPSEEPDEAHQRNALELVEYAVRAAAFGRDDHRATLAALVAELRARRRRSWGPPRP